MEVNRVERGRTYLFKCKNCCHLLSTNKGQDLAQTSCLPHFGKKGQKKLQKDAEKFKGDSAQLEQCKKPSLTAPRCVSSTQIFNGTSDWPLFLSRAVINRKLDSLQNKSWYSDVKSSSKRVCLLFSKLPKERRLMSHPSSLWSTQWQIALEQRRPKSVLGHASNPKPKKECLL